MPPSSVTYYFSKRGAFRVDDITSTDLGINYYAPAFHGARFFVEADVLNLFSEEGIEDPDFVNKTVLTRRNNSSTARCLQSDGTTRCLAFNPFTDKPVEGVHYRKSTAFGQPTSELAYQTPRTYRISIGLKF